MGGALSLLAAEHAGVDVAVSFYGTPGIGHVRLALATVITCLGLHITTDC